MSRRWVVGSTLFVVAAFATFIVYTWIEKGRSAPAVDPSTAVTQAPVVQ